MTRRHGRFLAVLLCFIAPVSQVRAQMDLGVNCTTSAFTACASVVLWTDPNPTTGHPELFLRMSNVQGTSGYTSLIPSGLVGFYLNNLWLTPSITDAAFTNIWISNSNTGNVRDQCSITTGTCAPGPYTGPIAADPDGNNNADGTSRIFGDIWSGNSGGLVWGCDVPNLGVSDLTSRYSTCGGLVTWRISLAHLGSSIHFTNQTSVTIAFRNGAGALAQCTTGVDCITATPEPATLILLGTGLAGIAGARRRRRRRS